jgi:hypothetical protein
MTEGSQPLGPPRIRPTGVWLIFLFYVLTSAWGLVFQCLLMLGLYTLRPEQQAIIGNVSVASRLYGIFGLILNLVAATSLWLLRKSALALFLVGFALGVASTLWQFLPGGIYNKMIGQSVLMSAITMFSVAGGLLVNAAIVWYVWHLRRQGVLR